MDEEQYKELLRKMGIGEDQFKYFTTAKEELPGLYGFGANQSKQFLDQFGGMPKFDPNLAMESYGEVERFGKEQKSDIRDQVSSGLMTGVQDVVENVGRGFTKSGARQGAISGVMGEVKRKGNMALSSLGEKLGQRRAAVGRTAFDYLGGLTNLASSIYSADPSKSGTSGTSNSGSSLVEGVEIDTSMPKGIEERMAQSLLISYFQANDINTGGSQYLFDQYSKEFADERKNRPELTADEWWAETYGATS